MLADVANDDISNIKSDVEDGSVPSRKVTSFSEIVGSIGCGLCCWMTCGCITLLTCWPIYFLYLRFNPNKDPLFVLQKKNKEEENSSYSSLDDPLLVQEDCLDLKYNEKSDRSYVSDLAIALNCNDGSCNEFSVYEAEEKVELDDEYSIHTE